MFNVNNFFLIRPVFISFDWIVTYVNNWNYNLITYANNLYGCVYNWNYNLITYANNLYGCVNNWNYNLFNCANNLYVINLNYNLVT